MVACSPACSLAYSFLFASNACSHDREHVLTAYSECIRHSSSASCFGPLEQKTICSFMSDLTLANAAIWNRAGIAPEACMPSQPFPAFAWSTVRHSRVRARTVITNSWSGRPFCSTNCRTCTTHKPGGCSFVCCACPRAQHAFRTFPTASTREYAVRHDARSVKVP